MEGGAHISSLGGVYPSSVCYEAWDRVPPLALPFACLSI